MTCLTNLRIILFAGIFMLAFQTTSAQKVYVQFYTGYAISAVEEDLGSPFPEIGMVDFVQADNGSLSVKPIYGNIGSGFRLSGAAGYMFNKNVGIEMEFFFTRSTNITIGRFKTPTYDAIHDVYTFRFSAAPQLFLTTSFPKKINIYTKSGMIFPIVGKAVSEVTIDDDEGRLARDRFNLNLPGANTDFFAEAVTRASFSYGFRMAIGIDLKLNDRLHFFSELAYHSLIVKVRKSTITQYSQRTFAGTIDFLNDGIEDIPESFRITNYLNEITETSNSEEYNPTTFDEDLAAESLSFKQNYSNAGLHLGVRLFLGEKTADGEKGFDSF